MDSAGLDAVSTADIRTLLETMTAAWNRGDGAAYGEVFAEDAQYVSAPGERLHGRRAIAESHQKIFDTFFKGTRISGSGQTVCLKPIAPDVVLVESSGAVLFPGESDGSVAPNGLMTMVVARQGGAWRIVSFQNTPTGRLRMVRFLTRYVRSRLRGRAGIEARAQ